MSSKSTELTTESFLALLPEMMKTGIWEPWIGTNELGGIIRLRNKEHGGRQSHSPRTALYYHLTRTEVINCFWLPEMTEQFGLPWNETLEIAYAEDHCEAGKRYDKNLRNRILIAIGLPPEGIARG